VYGRGRQRFWQISGKACIVIHGTDAGGIVPEPCHNRLAPQVQCSPQKKWGEGTAQGNET
jgi:hypothetical protein